MDLLTELTRANHDPDVIAKVRALIAESASVEQVMAKNKAMLAERDFKIAALTLELAYYRRINYGKKSEACWRRPNIDPPRRSKFDPGRDAAFLSSSCG